MQIITNKIQCNHCKEIIESKKTHDFKMCKCQKVGIDGGNSFAHLPKSKSIIFKTYKRYI